MAEMDYISMADTTAEEINFIETDAEEMMNRLVEWFEEYTGEVLYPGDERRMFIQGFGYPLTNTEIHINETGRGNLLRYATASQLDAIGDLFRNKRLEGSFARTTLEFQISKAQTVDIVIPHGTRVTPDGTHYFATVEDLIFPANDSTLIRSVGATAVEVGEAFNDFLPGQVNKLVESNEYVQGVRNVTATNGGTEKETDEDYRNRLRLSPFSFAVAGPSNAYRSIAMSVSTEIEDVYVHSPSAGVVEILFTKTGGVIPADSDPLIEGILAACNDETVRPLTDYVQVKPATAVNTDVDIQYYVPNGDTSVMAAVIEAVEEYKTWQTSKIGRDINPDYLNKLLLDAGAARVVILSPVYTKLEGNQIAQIIETRASYGGSISM